MRMNILEMNEIKTDSISESRVAEANLTVWLVDDRKDIRQMIATLLEREGGFRCAGQFEDTNALLSFLALHTPPDIILLDINLGSRNGLDALRTIKFVSPCTRVFILTTFWDSQYYVRAFREGASGFLLKTTDIREIAKTLRRREPALPMHLACANPTLPERKLPLWQRSVQFLSGVLGSIVA